MERLEEEDLVLRYGGPVVNVGQNSSHVLGNRKDGAKCEGSNQLKSKKLGQRKDSWFPGSLEWQLYCIFIQPLNCSLDFADSRTGPRIVHSLPRSSQRALVTSPGAVAAVGPAMP